MKTCTKCNASKEYIYFHKDKSTKDGYYPSCIVCNAHRRSDIDKKRIYDKKYRTTLGFKKAANQHKVTVSFLENLLLNQNHLCAICKKPEMNKHQSGVTMRLAIDHCHTTNKVRGFLCQKCNQGLGMFLDNKELLKEAISYLSRL